MLSVESWVFVAYLLPLAPCPKTIPSIVLAFFLGAVAIFDGMARTVVIACEAGQALAVVHPLRHPICRHTHILCRTYRHALAAMDAAVGLDMKRTVVDQVFHEDTAYHPAVDAGPPPSDDPMLTALAIGDLPGILIQQLG